jgi:hypothetical protein
LQDRVSEYRNLEQYYSKKLERTKEEFKHQIEQFKQRVNSATNGTKPSDHVVIDQ